MTDGEMAAATAAGSISTGLVRAPKRRLPVTPTLLAGAIILVLIVVMAIIGPLATPYARDAFVGLPLQPPSLAHLFGTDNFGRDILTRVLHATYLNLLIGLVPTGMTFITGITLGSIAGYYGGKLDTVIMRLVDIVVAFPFLVLVIGIVAMLGPGIRNLFIGVGLVGWISYARIVRGEILVAKHQEYVIAAQSIGCTHRRIILRHILPNVLATAVVFSMSDIVLNIILGASLSFLGLGVQPPTPEWGSMIQEARLFIRQAWWITAFPGLAIMVTGIGFSLLGDGLAELLLGER